MYLKSFRCIIIERAFRHSFASRCWDYCWCTPDLWFIYNSWCVSVLEEGAWQQPHRTTFFVRVWRWRWRWTFLHVRKQQATVLFAFDDRTVASGSDVRTSRATTFDSFSLDSFVSSPFTAWQICHVSSPSLQHFCGIIIPFAIWALAMIAFQELEIVSRGCVMSVA
jgi:hypothetical protein